MDQVHRTLAEISLLGTPVEGHIARTYKFRPHARRADTHLLIFTHLGDFITLEKMFPRLKECICDYTKIKGNLMPLFKVAHQLHVLTLEGCAVWIPVELSALAEQLPHLTILNVW